MIDVMEKKNPKKRIIIGWREYISLPEFNIPRIKVKVDTGANTSALHVTNLKMINRDGDDFAQFYIHPIQKKIKPKYKVELKIIEHRSIKSSNGFITVRPVVFMPVKIGPFYYEIEVTLINRDLMGFRMLLGRKAMKGKFLVNPSGSFLLDKLGAIK